MTNCVSVPDQYHWNLLHPNQIAFSRLMTDRALTEWFERVEEYMPKVEDYEVPDPITLGEPFAISGAGYHEGDRVELSIKFSDESVMPLGEVPLDHGAFRWEGEIPETAPSGLANFTMQVLDGTEVVWGITIESVTVAAPTGGGAATGLPDDATWVLDLLDGRPLIEETFISLELHGDRLWGLDGCNSFASQPGDGTIIAQADGSFSTPKVILRTLRGCEDLLSDQADAYMAALREAEKFRAVDDRLEVFDSAGATRLVFLRQQPLPGHPVELVGTEWRLLPEGDGEDMGAVTLGLPQRLSGGRYDRLPRLRCGVQEIARETGLCLLVQDWIPAVMLGGFTRVGGCVHTHSVVDRRILGCRVGRDKTAHRPDICGQDTGLRASAASRRGDRRRGMVLEGLRTALLCASAPGWFGCLGPTRHGGRASRNRGDDLVRRGRHGGILGVQLLRGSGEARGRVDHRRLIDPYRKAMCFPGRSDGTGGALPRSAAAPDAIRHL